MATAPSVIARPTQEDESSTVQSRRGHRNGGVVPFGYRREYREREGRFVLVADPREGDQVGAIFTRYLRVRSLARLVSSLTEEGIRTREGKPWSRATAAFVLSNKVYLGKATRGEESVPEVALVAPIVFHKVQQLKRRNDRRGGKGRSP